MRAATGIDQHEVCSGGTDMHRAKVVPAGTARDRTNRPGRAASLRSHALGATLQGRRSFFCSCGNCQLGHAVEFDFACVDCNASFGSGAKPFQIVRRTKFILLGIGSTQSFLVTTRIVFAVSAMRIPLTQTRPRSRKRKVSMIAPCKSMRTIRSPRFCCDPSLTAWIKLRQSKPC